VLLIFVGFFSINFLSFANVLLQTESIPSMRGRVMSLWAVAFLGSTPIGAPIIGWVGQNIGPRYSLVLGSFAALVASGIGLIFLRKVMKAKVVENIK
jgi:MFS family permease